MSSNFQSGRNIKNPEKRDKYLGNSISFNKFKSYIKSGILHFEVKVVDTFIET